MLAAEAFGGRAALEALLSQSTKEVRVKEKRAGNASKPVAVMTPEKARAMQAQLEGYDGRIKGGRLAEG